MIKQNKKGFLVGLVLLGVIGSGALFAAFNANMVDVVVATQTLNGNTKITSNMITTKRVDKGALPENFITAKDAQKMVGRYTNIGITEGSIFTTGNVATKDNKKSAVIPEGQTLLSITIDSLPQGVQSGDNVNLLIGINMQNQGKVVMTYQNIMVTNTYLDENGLVTGLEVQVTPEQAQKIQYAQINGDLSVSLLPLGYENQELPIVNEDEMQTYQASSGNTSTNVSVDDEESDSSDDVDISVVE